MIVKNGFISFILPIRRALRIGSRRWLFNIVPATIHQQIFLGNPPRARIIAATSATVFFGTI
jgi:hypothetical protein